MATRPIIKPEEIAHDDQLVIWVDEMEFALLPWLADLEDYEDRLRRKAAIRDELKRVVEITCQRIKDELNN